MIMRGEAPGGKPFEAQVTTVHQNGNRWMPKVRELAI